VRAIVVSASNQRYFPLLRGLLDSIEANGPGKVEIGVLDTGIESSGLAELRDRSVKVVNPGWDYDLSHIKQRLETFHQAMTARPNLPKHFPGYDLYVWLDGDTWVQDWSGIDDYMKLATDHGFAVTPECDRSYWPLMVLQDRRQVSVEEFRRHAFKSTFAPEFANILAAFPMINCGCFAARSDAPHWKRWSDYLGQIIKAQTQSYPFYAEQNALNAIIRNEGLRAVLLPATYNWLCALALPMLNGEKLVEPNPPFEPIKVVHLAAQIKNGRYNLAVLGGGHREQSLRFGGDAHSEIDLSFMTKT
jgi:hypothetical protein